MNVKPHRFYLCFILILIFSLTAMAQMPKGMPPGMMGKMGAASDAVDLPERDRPAVFRLDNGMEFLLLENHASPVIASVIVVRTGSRNESIELNGATHFLEHLLFNGTETRTQKQLYDEMDYLGGYNNANTTHDHTNFMILLEKSKFAQGLDIQADMLFHSTLPEDKFEKEKGIVVEEIGKDEDSESYRVSKFFDSAQYKGTPYEWPILGSRRSIGAMEREKVWEYYKQYYVPNNMVGLIIGDFHTPEMMELLKQTFGEIPPRELPMQEMLGLQSFRPDPDDGRTIYHMQGPGTSHHIRYSLWAPTREYPEFYSYLIVKQMLGEHLDRELVQNADLGITSVGAYQFVDADFSFLNIELDLKPSASIENALEALEEAINSFLGILLDPDEIKAITTSILSEEFFNAERPHFYGMLKSDDLAQGGPYFLLDYVQRLEAVEVGDVQNTADLFLNIEHPLISIYESVQEKEPQAAGGAGQADLVSQVLPNGMTVMVQQNADNQIFAAHFLFRHRSAYEKALGMPSGTVDFLHHLFDYGPADMSQEQFEDDLQALGARVKFYDMSFIPYDDYYTTPEFSYIRLEVIDDNHSPVLSLLARTLKQPTYTADAIEMVRTQMIGQARQDAESVSKTGRKLFSSAIYGDLPLGDDIIGSPEDFATLDQQMLKSFAKQYISPENLILTIITPQAAAEVIGEVEQLFGSWKVDVSLPAVEYSKPSGEPQRIEEPGGKEQSYFAMGYVFEVKDAADKPALTIMNSILSDRMQFQLRETEGLAYTLGSSVTYHNGWGIWSARMGTGPQNLARAEAGIKEQMTAMLTEELTAREVEKARNAYLGRLAMRSLTRVNRAYMVGLGALRGQDADWFDAWLNGLRQVELDDVKRVAQNYLQTERMTVTIVR